MKKKTIQKWAIAVALSASVVLAGCIAKDRLADNSRPSSASLKKFATSVRKVDGQAESHYKMALYFQKNRRHKLAIEELKRALKSNPDMAKAYNAMGVSFDKMHQYDKAVRCYFAASKIDPTLDYVHNNLGYSQLLRGNHQKAIKAFQHAIRLNGENNRYRNNLALAYVMDEQYDLAAEQFEIVDSESDSKQRLANLLYDLGKVKYRQFLKKPSEGEDHTGVIVAENKPAEPVVIRKKIELPIKQVQKDTPVPATAPSSADKPVAAELAGASSSETQPVPAEVVENGETDVNTAVAAGGVAADQQIHTTKRVSWEEPETVSAEDLSAAQSSAFPANPLHVSAVRIAAGKVAEPLAAAPPESSESRRPLDNRVPAEPRVVPQPKIVEVSPVGKYTPPLMQPYTVKPVTAAVRVRAGDTASSVRVITPTHAAAGPGKSTQSVPGVIEVAAFESPKSLAVAAPPKTKLPSEAFEVELEIANGNGVKGMAQRVGKYLELRGFKVVKIKNAHSPDHVSTKVLYSNDGKRDLDRLLAELSVIKDASDMIELDHLEKRIRVIVGKDMIAFQDRLADKN